MTYNLYADVVFINNFAMDFFLLIILRRIMKLEKRKWGIFVASVLGAAYALAVTIYPLPFAFIQFVSTYVLISGGMVWLAFPIKRARELLKAVAGLYLTVSIMGGLFNLLRIQGGISWYGEQIFFRGGLGKIPFFVYVMAAGGCFFMACFLWETVKTAELTNGHLYSVILYYKGKSQNMTAFMDTGNHLTEPFSRSPVSIISAESCGELFHTVSKIIYIPYSSVGKKDGVLPTVRADRMEIEKDGRKVTVEEPYIAISKESLSGDGTYHMLLNEKLWS